MQCRECAWPWWCFFAGGPNAAMDNDDDADDEDKSDGKAKIERESLMTQGACNDADPHPATAGEDTLDKDFQKPLAGGETTVDRLIQALHTSRTGFRRLPGFDPSIDSLEYYRLQQMVDCDEVYPRIYIGDGITAKNKQYLQKIGITHVLNAAEGKKFGMVNTNSDYYRDTSIRYLGLQMLDLPSTDISQFFYTAAAFIENAVSSGGRVFVHCVQGVSRSATLVIAYLMIKKRMLAADAIRTVRLGRDIHPNDGFLRQLARLDNQLRRHRLL